MESHSASQSFSPEPCEPPPSRTLHPNPPVFSPELETNHPNAAHEGFPNSDNPSGHVSSEETSHSEPFLVDPVPTEHSSQNRASHSTPTFENHPPPPEPPFHDSFFDPPHPPQDTKKSEQPSPLSTREFPPRRLRSLFSSSSSSQPLKRLASLSHPLRRPLPTSSHHGSHYPTRTRVALQPSAPAPAPSRESSAAAASLSDPAASFSSSSFSFSNPTTNSLFSPQQQQQQHDQQQKNTKQQQHDFFFSEIRDALRRLDNASESCSQDLASIHTQFEGVLVHQEQLTGRMAENTQHVRYILTRLSALQQSQNRLKGKGGLLRGVLGYAYSPLVFWFKGVWLVVHFVLGTLRGLWLWQRGVRALTGGGGGSKERGKRQGKGEEGVVRHFWTHPWWSLWRRSGSNRTSESGKGGGEIGTAVGKEGSGFQVSDPRVSLPSVLEGESAEGGREGNSSTPLLRNVEERVSDETAPLNLKVSEAENSEFRPLPRRLSTHSLSTRTDSDAHSLLYRLKGVPLES